MGATEAEQAEGQRVWDEWRAWVTRTPTGYTEFARLHARDEDASALPPPGWSEDEATAAAAYMEARARG